MSTNVIHAFQIGGYTYELRNVFCGKKQCSKCPHGPYYYLKFKLRTGRQVQKYLGKTLPAGVNDPEGPKPHADATPC